MDAQINSGGRKPPIFSRRLAVRVLHIAAVVLADIVLAAVIGVALLRYGPFENTRQFIIGSAMSSFQHQYIAEWIFTKAEIEQVTHKSAASTTQKQDLTAVNPTGTTDNSIVLSKIGDGLQGYALEIKNPLRVHVACTAYIGTRGEFVSTLAEKNNAVAAINGGGFSTGADTTGTGAIPSDFVFSNGKLFWKDDTLKPNKLPLTDDHEPVNVVALNDKGVLIVGDYTIDQLQSMNVTEAVDLHGYKPLVLDGKVQYTNDGGKGVQPRTAIGQKKDGTIVLLVIDGRQAGTSGARLNQLADLLANQYDCWTAANLDGGASTAMYYQGNIINKPSAIFGERTVATAFYVSK